MLSVHRNKVHLTLLDLANGTVLKIDFFSFDLIVNEMYTMLYVCLYICIKHSGHSYSIHMNLYRGYCGILLDIQHLKHIQTR